MRLIVVAVRLLLSLLTVIIMTSSLILLLLPLPTMTTAKNSKNSTNSKTTETQVETETIRHTTSNSLPHPLLPPPTIQRQLQLRPSTYTGKILRKITRLIRRFSSDTTHSSIYDHYYEEYYNPKLAFEMAILSNLSYLDFHKELPTIQRRPSSAGEVTGFSLLKGNDDYHNSDLLLSTIHKLSSMIKNSHPITFSLSSHSKSYSNRRINKENGEEEEKKRNNDSSNKNSNNPYYNFEYFFYNWYEPTGVKGVNFHDTDVLISTTTTTTSSSKTKMKSLDLDSDSDYYSTTTTKSPNTLIITFAGTSSYADAFTNIQTFEPANHSRFFEPLSSPSSSPSPRPSPSRPSPHPSDDDVDEDVRNKWKRKRKRRYNTNTNSNTNSSSSSPSLIQGSLHRGFLNAYSRVERGSVLRLSSLKSRSKYNTTSYTSNEKKKKKRRLSSLPHIIDGLHKRFGRCTADYIDDDSDDNDDNDDNDNDNDETTMDSNTIPPLDKRRQRNKKKNGSSGGSGGGSGRGGGCKFTKKGEEIRLSIVLKELVNNALKNGYTVHVTGHSLGGALATLLVLDVLVNNNNDDNDTDNDNDNGNDNDNNNNNNNSIDIPTTNLHLWTYGAPQVADSLFLESVTNNSKKLRNFLGIIGMDKRRSNRRRQRERERQRKHNHHKKQFHRFVTLSDDGKVDVVSEVAKTALAAHKELDYLQEEDNQGTTSTTTATTKGATDTDTKTDTDDNTDDSITQNKTDNNVATTTTSNNNKKKKRSTKKSIRSKRRKWLRTNLLHGKVARSLGGVSRGGHSVTHFIEPHYLWTPDQYQRHHDYYDQEHYYTTTTSTSNPTNNFTSTTTSNSSSSNTRSSVAAHSMSNYLIGISREACSCSSTRRSTTNDKCNPLIPDVPAKWLEYLDINSYYVEVLRSTVI